MAVVQADKEGRLESLGAAAQIREHNITSPITPIFQLRFKTEDQS